MLVNIRSETAEIFLTLSLRWWWVDGSLKSFSCQTQLLLLVELSCVWVGLWQYSYFGSVISYQLAFFMCTVGIKLSARQWHQQDKIIEIASLWYYQQPISVLPPKIGFYLLQCRNNYWNNFIPPPKLGECGEVYPKIPKIKWPRGFAIKTFAGERPSPSHWMFRRIK